MSVTVIKTTCFLNGDEINLTVISDLNGWTVGPPCVGVTKCRQSDFLLAYDSLL